MIEQWLDAVFLHSLSVATVHHVEIAHTFVLSSVMGYINTKKILH